MATFGFTRIQSFLKSQMQTFLFKLELERLRKRSKVRNQTIAFNVSPVHSSWGGGNQWLIQICRYLAADGYKIEFSLLPSVNTIILVDPRVGPRTNFGIKEITRFKEQHPSVKCLHRINECDIRKGTSDVDLVLASANEVSDYTVFVSEWLADYHKNKWFDANKRHCAIVPGADNNIFYPREQPWNPTKEKLRIVTHHWSPNWLKGFDVYQELDRLIYDKHISNVELWIIGRWPTEIKWKAARTFPPMNGAQLACHLRLCHVYITASKWEPGSMHHIEGIQCGLPILYGKDGGGIVETARRYGIEIGSDLISAITKISTDYNLYYEKIRNFPPSGIDMCTKYADILRKL